MAEICCGVMNESETKSAGCETSSRAARRRRMEIRRVKFISGGAGQSSDSENGAKRPKLESISGEYVNALENCVEDDQSLRGKRKIYELPTVINSSQFFIAPILNPLTYELLFESDDFPKYGMSSVCGRRRDMEDAVAIQPSFYRREDDEISPGLHYFAVYDGHGCSHV